MIELLEQLRRIVGERNVLTHEEDRARYDSDGRGDGGQSLAVVRPANSAEVSSCVRVAQAYGVGIVPQGGRSGLVGAGLAADHIVVTLERLNTPCLIDPENRTAQVGAGVALSGINRAAAEYGLEFPIDLSADPSIGGMIASNTGGARFLRYGDVRRNLLQLEVVLADTAGSIVQLGRGLWKDNSGLDLKQLAASSSGSLAIITQATIALHPVSHNHITAFVALRHPKSAIDILLLLESHFGSLLTAFEGISSEALELVRQNCENAKAPFAGLDEAYFVLVELSAPRAVSANLLLEELSEALQNEFSNQHIIDVVVDNGKALWSVRHAVPEALRLSGRVIACDVSLKRGDLMKFRAFARDLVREEWPELQLADFGHIGDGGLHFNMVWGHDHGDMPEELPQQVRDNVMELAVAKFGGSFSAEHGVGPTNIKYYQKYTPAKVRELSGRTQETWAPQGLGRVDFGA